VEEVEDEDMAGVAALLAAARGVTPFFGEGGGGDSADDARFSAGSGAWRDGGAILPKREDVVQQRINHRLQVAATRRGRLPTAPFQRSQMGKGEKHSTTVPFSLLET